MQARWSLRLRTIISCADQGSLTLAMGKCLWFSVKIKVCQSSLSSPEYFMAVKSVFDIKCFKDVKFWVEQSVLHYNI